MEQNREKGSEDDQTLWAVGAEFTGYGLTWALSVLLFLLGGWWIDERLGTTPLLMIVGAFVGAGAGFYSLYRHVMASSFAEDGDGADTPGDRTEREAGDR